MLCVFRTLLALLLLPALSAPLALAYNGEISFSPGEIFDHARNSARITEAAAACLRADLARHRSFLAQYRISAFYGDNSSFAVKKTFDADGRLIRKVSTTREEKRQILRELGISESLVQEFVPERRCARAEDCPLALEPTSCIGIALKCLSRGFEAAGEGDRWRRIRAFVRNNKVQGDAFQYALQKIGWKLAFWNPATQLAAEWDAAERKTFPPRRPGEHRGVWGQHARSLREVMQLGRYGQNRIDDKTSLVDFGETTPELLLRVPFFVGIAHRGYHVFSGAYGQVLEGHSERRLDDYYAVEDSPFNPLSESGGPRGGPYKSGVIALPPGIGASEP